MWDSQTWERERERERLNKPKPSHYNAAILHWRQWPPASVILLQATTTTMSLSWKGNRMSGPSSPHHNWGHLLWPSPRSTLESTNNSKVGITILWEISISLLSNLLDINICCLKILYVEVFFCTLLNLLWYILFILRVKIQTLAICQC